MCCYNIIHKFIASLYLLVAFVSSADATDYFLDAAEGNDAWPGTQADAGNNNGPWRTLARLQGSNLQAGDRVLLRCTGIWTESLSLQIRGTETTPIFIGAYGDCTVRRPEIRPAEIMLPPYLFKPTKFGWAAPLSTSPVRVFTQDETLHRARFPATGMLPLHWNKQQLQVQLSSLPISPEILNGADIVVRTNDYTFEERRLYGMDHQGSITLDKTFVFKPRDGSGYYLEGQPWMLPYSGGWAYDYSSGMLVLREKPLYPVYAGTKRYAVALDRSEHIRLQGLGIRFVAGSGVDVANSNNIEIDNLEVMDVTDAFIRSYRTDNLTISNLHGQRSQRDGIVIKHGMNSSVTDCQLEDVGVSPNPRKSIAAISVEDSLASLVARNHIERTGYAAIMFGKDSLIERNVIVNACLKLADCGAIYTSGARKRHGHYNSTAAHNLISGVPGNLEGTPSSHALTAGIYLDDESRGIQLNWNYVEKAQRGIFSKASASQIKGNTLFNNQIGLMLTGMGAHGNGMGGNQIIDNVLVSLPKQKLFLISANTIDIPLVSLTNNVLRYAGSPIIERWLDNRKLAEPAPDNSRKISKAISLANTSRLPRSFSCPFSSSDCNKFRKSNDDEVFWPLWLMPGESTVLILSEGT